MISMNRMVLKFLLFMVCCSSLWAANLPLSQFLLNNYAQNVDQWLSPQDPQYKTPLLSKSYQKKRFNEFYNHLYATADDALSPWSKGFVSEVLNKDPSILAEQEKYLEEYSNQNKDPKQLGYGENFHPYPLKWIEHIANNIDMTQFGLPMKYIANNRPIVVRNTAFQFTLSFS